MIGERKLTAHQTEQGRDRTHTHLGNCQICGRQHAVDVTSNLIANHGYTVEWSQHNNTCEGSKYLPLQLDRTQTDAYVATLGKVFRNTVRAIWDLRSGRTVLKTVGNYIDEYHAVRSDKFEVVDIAWEQANDYSRRRGLKAAIGRRISEARWARSHAKSLTQLANVLHGKPLVEDHVEQREKVKSAKKANRAEAAARKEQLYRLGRAFEKGYDQIEDIYLTELRVARDTDENVRGIGDAKDSTYGGVMYPNQWTAKRRANVLSAWAGNAEVAEIVTKLDAIVAEHTQLKAAIKAAKEAK
jgi:hypothetical protein